MSSNKTVSTVNQDWHFQTEPTQLYAQAQITLVSRARKSLVHISVIRVTMIIFASFITTSPLQASLFQLNNSALTLRANVRSTASTIHP
jgi:hypothetical protein